VTDKAPVTADNFPRAETDMYFARFSQGKVGVLLHHREPATADNQKVVRDNPNVLGSVAVFDLGTGPVTLTLPDAGERFVSLMVTDEDHYTYTTYDSGEHTLAKETIGNRYVFVAIRILVDPSDPDDVAAVHALQDAMVVDQPDGPGTFEIPDWDADSQKKVRDALISLGDTLLGSNRMFGTREQVDPVRHLIGTAVGWGGNNEHDAFYAFLVPEHNDGDTVYAVTFGDLPIDSWWGVSVYNAEGYFEKNDRDVYTINSINAVANDDGSFTVQFGGCDDATANCLPIFPGWNYAVRLYLPRQEVIDGTWTFPAAEAVSIGKS
jgi:hypothetical protein